MFTKIKRNPLLRLPTSATIMLQIVLCGCLSSPKTPMAGEVLRNQLTLLNESCRITPQSGFSADVLFDATNAARIDAVWDNAGNLSGQILNPLGEDLLNFRVESEGTLQTDVSLEAETALKNALEFIANLGPANTRLLLCSGLFLGYRNRNGKIPEGETAEVEFELRTNSLNWYMKSNLQLGATESANRNAELEINSVVFSSSSIFRKSLALVEWRGRSGGVRIRPHQILIHSGRTRVKLTFLDFE